jgi:hypothetical protein
LLARGEGKRDINIPFSIFGEIAEIRISQCRRCVLCVCSPVSQPKILCLAVWRINFLARFPISSLSSPGKFHQCCLSAVSLLLLEGSGSGKTLCCSPFSVFPP